MCGSWIKRFDFGNAFSDYGWEIDYIKPKLKAGSDDLSNLQPLHCNNNRAKGDKWPESRTVR
ncbi:MAG: HNH endonuclease [Bacteroidales bacterium]|nr:HNH endonuclease [Bacteroidales bacterium]